MHNEYNDIISRIAEPPTWWDENGTPRYGKFHPDNTANIYKDEAVLLLIECQECCRSFQVAMTSNPLDFLHKIPPLNEQVTAKSLHYGDPPNMGCCFAGPTMNCIDVRVLEFWRRGQQSGEWMRCTELEIELEGSQDEWSGLSASQNL